MKPSQGYNDGVTMKKYLWIVLIVLTVPALLTGCSLSGGETQKEVLKPLNAADWPTPPPSAPPASPTPFPKITLAPTATPTARPTEIATSTPTATGELSYSGNPDDLTKQITALSGGLEPVAAALVTGDKVALRQGPGTSYASIGVAQRGELAAVLGKNPAGDWLYVLTISQLQGWLPADTLRVTGALEKAPVLPPNPMAAGKQPSAVSSQPSAVGGQPSAVGGQPLAVADFAPVTTARVNNESLNMRQGPGAAYELLRTLSRGDEVAVLALNQTKDWVLVKTANGEWGWVSLAYLAVEGSLTGAPQVRSPAPGGDFTPGQVAPIFASTGESGAAVRSSGVSASPPGGVGPANGGRLVFQLSSGGDIMVINADGSGLHRLTHGIDPALSPDGQSVAFTRWNGEDGSLWIINVDGSNERPVLGETKQAKHPAWSPDGKRIVVNFRHGGRLEDNEDCVNMMKLKGRRPNIPWNVDSKTIHMELKGREPYLCWTLPPDPHWGLRTVNVADGSFEDVPSDAYAFGPEWDPANPWRIVSSGFGGLWQLDVNRMEQWALTDRHEDHTPAFSPDGRYLAVAFDQNGAYDIHRLNSDGSGRVRLTNTPLWVAVGPDKQKPWNNVSPAWSPDGSQIAFLTDRTGRWEIWVMGADGSNQRPMFSDAANNQLQISYNFVDEGVLSWR
jgi:uncharacterized protein YgiM (DUF1202 family)